MNATRSRPWHAPRWNDTRQQPAGTATDTALTLLAAVVFMDGLIHIGAGVDHFNEFPLYTLVFGAVAAVQIGWAAMLLRRPSRTLLLLGCGFTAGVIVLWAASRTVGVPIAPRPWVPETVGVADLIETVGEAVTVIAAGSIAMATQLSAARWIIRRIAPLLLAMLLLSALYGVGAHAG
jgi:hypothetical protein